MKTSLATATSRKVRTAKLERLKEKVAKDRIVSTFTSPKDLRGLVIHALGELRRLKRVQTTHPLNSNCIRSIIIPPRHQPYIAHPYSLLQTSQVLGAKLS